MKECPLAWSQCDGGVDGELERLWRNCAGLCWWCGGSLKKWQAAGHCLDRITSKRDHTPDNVQLACWPCNALKLSMGAETWGEWIEMKVKRYGRGKVPFDDIDGKRFRLAKPIDLSRFLICEYRQLPLALGGRR